MNWIRYVLMFLSFLLLLNAGDLDAQRRRHHRRRPVKADVTVKKIAKKAIPPAVVDSFQARYPGAAITAQTREVREGIPYYDLQGSDSLRLLDVLFEADGKMVEVGESVDDSDLPESVRQGVLEKYPGSKVESAERVTRGTHVEYQLTLRSGGRKIEVVSNMAGKVFLIQ